MERAPENEGTAGPSEGPIECEPERASSIKATDQAPGSNFVKPLLTPVNPHEWLVLVAGWGEELHAEWYKTYAEAMRRSAEYERQGEEITVALVYHYAQAK